MKKTFVTVALIATAAFLNVACVSLPFPFPFIGTERETAVYVPELPEEARERPVLGIIPFYGGEAREGDTIATLFSHQPAFLEAFNVVTRTGAALDAIFIEHGTALTSLTDSDAIAGIGRLLNADYVLSGSIRRLGDMNLLIATIVNVETFEQVAGAYHIYVNLGDAPGFLPAMTRAMVDSTVRRGTARRENLAVVPFVHRAGISAHDAYTLTQILAIELIRTGRYAVLPRTSAIQSAMAEQEFQLDGYTVGGGMAALGRAINADLVLNGEIARLGDVNIFMAQILRVADGSVVIGTSRNYLVIGDGINLMPEIAILLTEPDPTSAEIRLAAHREEERRRLAALAAEAAEARRRQEAAEAEVRRRQAAAEAEIRRMHEAEARSIRRAAARRAIMARASRNEWEWLSFSYLMEGGGGLEGSDGPRSGFSFGLLLNGFYWSPLPFANIGVEARVTTLSHDPFGPGDPNFRWYFGLSPTVGLVYPLGEGARIFTNFQLEFGSLPGSGLFWDRRFNDRFGLGLTPGFEAGMSFGRGGTFSLRYRCVWFYGTFIHSFGIGLGNLF